MSDPYLNMKFGSVRLLRKLGQGSMGLVYQGYHEAFSTDVAVKILKPVNNEAKEQFYQRFLREGRAAARVRHEHVVQVMDAGHEHGVAYLVLEFVQGASLGEILDKKKRIDQKTVMRLGEQIALGLAAIHSEEIIHRDIKPDNILLGQGGIIKIADLGLAKELDQESVNRLTMSGMVVGTPYYISPEAISDITNAKPAADVYSFGATMYHLLTGRPPFDGATAYEVMRSHLESRFQPLREIDSNINPNLANLIERCLDKNPDRRPHAKEIATLISRGGRVQSGARGIGFLAAIVIAIIGAIALFTWKLLPQQTAYEDLIVGENASAVQIQSSHKNTEIKVNHQQWKPLSVDSFTLAAGKHSVLLRSYEDGVLMHWQQEITATEEPLELHAQLRPIPIEPQTLAVNGAFLKGILTINGRCLGIENHFRFDKAGVYKTVVWDAQHNWHARDLEIDINGKVVFQDWQQSHQIPLDAYLSNFVDQEQTTAHHVMTWLECERIRQQHHVLEPVGWDGQSLQGHQYARNISAPLAMVLEEWALKQQLRFPSTTEATKLKNLYHASLWHKDGRHRRVLGRQDSAIVILLPQ